MATRNPTKDTASTLDLDRQICHSLYSASNALVRAYRPLLQQLDLTYPQYVVMMSLWQRDKVSNSELARHTRFDAGTLTPMLKRLQDKGLITSTVAKSDERRRIVSLTKKGRGLKKTAKTIPEQIACTANMSVKDALELKALCEALFTRLSVEQ